jgi:hypothetical protein
MSTIVKILLHPLLNGLGSGTADWPSLAAVIVWLLAAALLGSLLHRLREPDGGLGSSRPVRRSARGRASTRGRLSGISHAGAGAR